MMHSTIKKNCCGVLILIIILMLIVMPSVFAVEEYDLWIGTTRVTNENASNVLDDSGDATVVYNATTNTLILNEADIKGGITEHSSYGIMYLGDKNLNIVANGTNFISSPDSTELGCSAGITVGGEAGQYDINIDKNVSLNIVLNEDSSLNISSGNVSGTSYPTSFGIVMWQNFGNLIISGEGSIAVQPGMASYCYAINALGDLVLNTSGLVGFIGPEEVYYSVGALAGNITIEQGQLAFSGGTADLASYAISTKDMTTYAEGNITINGGDISAISGSVPDVGGTYDFEQSQSYAVYCAGDFSINGGLLDAYTASSTGDHFMAINKAPILADGINAVASTEYGEAEAVVDYYAGKNDTYVWFRAPYKLKSISEIEAYITIPTAGTVITIDDENIIDIKHSQSPRPKVYVPDDVNYHIAKNDYFGDNSDAVFWYADSDATELFSGEMLAGETYYADLWFYGNVGYAISKDATVTINFGNLKCIKTDFEAYDQSGYGAFRAIVPVEIPLVPQNGIPLVIIRIDESEAAIQIASDEDDEHEYGTIEEMNDSYHHTVRCVGTMEIVIPEGYESEYDLSNNPTGQMPLEYIRGRGNSTWMLSNKKPYKIKYKEKQDVLGMGKNKEWGLLANAYDPTLIHNDVVSWLGEQMGMDYTSKMVPVDVVMIGTKSGTTFLGSYTLTELVDIGKNRVDIPELDDDDIEDITGGYLLSIYYYDQDFKEPENTVFETEYGKIKLINENPYFDSGELTEAQEAQRTYIRDYVNQIDELIMNNDVITEEIHNQIADLLDLKSTADFYLMQEFLVNFDGFKTSSNYFYKTPDTEQKKGKLYFGPIWDFDLMFYMVDIEEPEQIKGFNRVMPFAWVDKLRNDDPFFVDILKEEWNTLNNEINNITKENGILDKYKETIRNSWNANYNRYKDENPFYGHEANIDDEIEELRTLFELRQKWFNDNIDDIGKVFFTVKFKVENEIIKEEVVRGNTLMEAPEGVIPQKEGYLFKEWVRENDNDISISDQLIVSDVTFVPNYIKTDDIEGKIALYFPTYEVWIPLEDETYQLNGIAYYPEEQYEALSKSIVWKSSNEDVATIDYNGEVTLIKVGDTTITGTLFNGISKSYILHVCGENQEFVHNTTEVNFEKVEFTIEVGDTDQIIYHVLPEPVDSYIYADYELSNQDIIEFNSTALSFIGLKEGKVTISLKVVNSDDDNYAEFEKDIIVNVKAKNSSKPKTSGGGSSRKKTSKESIWSNVDDWAKEEMEKAEKLELIPESFKGKDFISKSSRQDFTSVAVKLYEILSGKKAILPDNNPFTDTNDDYVLKAYKLGITLGVSENEFGNGTITREQMATMIDRTLKQAGIDIKVDLESITKFTDDNEMHNWGRYSVYAMAKEEIIKGVGDNKFNPLGESKIEEAIAIALRCVEKYQK